MTLQDLRDRIDVLIEQGYANSEIRSQVDMSDGLIDGATIPVDNIAKWIVVESPTEFEGVYYSSEEFAQKEIDRHFENVPLNERDDDELKAREFFLIEG